MVCQRSCRACMRICCRSRVARRVAKFMRSFLPFGRVHACCAVTPDSAAPMALGAQAVPGPPHASTLHAQEPSKSNAIRSDAEKALASQAVLSYPDLGQEASGDRLSLL